jgi:hypothetical protein
MSNNETVVAVQGPGNSLDVYFSQDENPAWSENVVAGTSCTYSAPSVAEMSNNATVVTVQGPGYSLDVYFNQDGNPAWSENVVAGTGSTNGAPSVAVAPFGSARSQVPSLESGLPS